MTTRVHHASGWPGTPARWTSSAKTGLGTALSYESTLWFTISHGIVNEVFYPRIDQACIRDMGLIVADGRQFFSEEKRHTTGALNCIADGVPAYQLTNTCQQGCYRTEKEICTDPHRPVLLQRTRFSVLDGARDDLQLYVLLAPHLGNHGGGNTGWMGDYKGVPMLFAERRGNALALACSAPWLKRTVGFVGYSDGWQDLAAHKELISDCTRAENGNVALTGQIDWRATQGRFVLALAFGRTPAEAGNHARAALQCEFDATQADYVRRWKEWQDSLLALDQHRSPSRVNVYRVSTMVMRAHEADDFGGGLIASLSIPWGSSKGDDDSGGYHLAWPRDLVETAGGLLAAGAHAEVVRVLHYLQATQEADGHWAQNMWLDGSPYWSGVQMDETALPILLVDLVRRQKILKEVDSHGFWPMVRAAAGYLTRNGPVSLQDRWEEDCGYSPFTIGAEIAALLAAADLADTNHESAIATYLRETADVWNASIDRWMYVSGTDWCEQFDVRGYYIRIAPMEEDGMPGFRKAVPVKNAPAERATAKAAYLVSPDALALVRFGLRRAEDPRILDTVKVIDAMLKVETSQGPCWHRYNGDGYGEHANGDAFDGTGIGRAWPLLTAERAHYELAAGRIEQAKRLLVACEAFASEGGLIPEQIWDAADVAERELFFGRPSGSAMPLVWAHAEYTKLCRSLRDGRVFDMPPQTVRRYLIDETPSPRLLWKFNHKIRWMPVGKMLRIETQEPALIHWSANDWRTSQDLSTRDVGLGIFVADLPTETLLELTRVRFTFYWPEADRWEGVDFLVRVDSVRYSWLVRKLGLSELPLVHVHRVAALMQHAKTHGVQELQKHEALT
jgi:glucoamylase